MKFSVAFLVCALITGCVVDSSRFSWSHQTVAIAAGAHQVQWATCDSLAPSLSFVFGPDHLGRDIPVWNSSFGRFTPPPRQFFVPICCDVTPSYADIPIVDDHGTTVSSLHADGFSSVLVPFAKENSSNPAIVFTHAPKWVEPFFAARSEQPTRAWKVYSIYLLGIEDTADNRKRAAAAGSLEEILCLAQCVLEVPTKMSLKLEDEQKNRRTSEGEVSELKHRIVASIRTGDSPAQVRATLINKFNVAPERIQWHTMSSPWKEVCDGRMCSITHTFLAVYRNGRPSWIGKEAKEFWVEVFFDQDDRCVNVNVELKETGG